MTLFGFRKKEGKEKEGKEPEVSICSYEPAGGIYCVKVLGTGCKACHEQYENTKEAIKTMGLAVEVEYITDIEKITDYGVMAMPAIVVNEKVVSAGRILKHEQVEKIGG